MRGLLSFDDIVVDILKDRGIEELEIELEDLANAEVYIEEQFGKVTRGVILRDDADELLDLYNVIQKERGYIRRAIDELYEEGV